MAFVDKVVETQGLELLVVTGWDSVERCWRSLCLDCWVYAELVLDTLSPGAVMNVPEDRQAGGRRLLIKILAHL